ncbi:MAG: helix-turn-helix transcriptional regulator [Bacteroidia bacterium]|jgi:transcriptional regulator with XRE-family HTH domain|nr:helix-turn-helix transcriptional regulator [Bacteroidia bacterium]MCC6768194.1 helix-turn-helix transcriptional regulator [Bacteroidia bacterium]
MKQQADRLRLIRVSKGMSQESVAKALDITVGAYSKIERGVTRLNLDRIDQISKVFDIEVNDFIRYINGEQDSLDRKLAIPGTGNGHSSNDQEILLLRKIVHLYDESREINIKAALKNQFEDNKVDVGSFFEVLRNITVNLSQKKLDAEQITNFNKGIEMLGKLLS